MKKWLFGLFLVLLAPSVFAANLFTPAMNDQSILYLSTLFGNVGHVLERGGSDLLRGAFIYFNNSVLVLGTVVIVYSLVVSTINTANDGETLGKKWNSVWVPARSALGFSLLLPVGVGSAKGYALCQVIVMWIIVQGVGAADKLWANSVDMLVSGQAMPNISLGMTDGQEDAFDLTSAAFQSEVCSYQLAAQMSTPTQKFHAMLYPILGGGSDSSSSTSNNAVPVGYKFGIYPQTYTDNNGNQQTIKQDVCGSITTWGANPVIDTTVDSLQDTAQNGADAFQNASQNNPDDPLQSMAQSQTRYELEASLAVGQMIRDVDQMAQQYVADYTAVPSALTDNETESLQYGLQSAGLAYQSRLDDIMNEYNMAQGDKHTDQINNISENAKNNGWASAGVFFIYMGKLFNAEGRSPDFTQASGNLYTVTDLANLVGISGSDPTDINSVSQPLGPMLGTAATLSDPDEISTGVYNSVDTSRWKVSEPDNPNNSGGNYVCQHHVGVYTVGFGATAGALPAYCATKAFYHSMKGLFGHGKKDAKNFPGVFLFMAQMVIYISMTLFKMIIGGGVNQIAGVMNAGVAASNNANNVMPNPIVSLQYYGYALLTSVEHMWFRMMVFLVSVGIASFSCSGQNTPLGIFTSLMSYTMPLLAAAMLMFLFIGATMAFYVPLVPYLLFTFGTLNWLMLSVEAMAAAPIMALGVIHPEGQHDVWGHANQGVMILANVFLRPSLMIIGFLAATLMSYVAVALVNAGFYVAANSLLPLDGAQVREMWNSSYMSLFGCVMIWMIYAMTIIVALNQAFKLIHQVPDKVMRWIGMAPEHTDTPLDEIKGQVKSVSDAGGSAMKGVQEGQKSAMKMMRGGEKSGGDKGGDGEISGAKAAVAGEAEAGTGGSSTSGGGGT